MIRLVIADDQRILREALETILRRQADFEIVGIAPDGQQAAELAIERDADVVLMDMRMPGSDGLDGLRRLKARGKRIQVLILTTYPDEEAARQALIEGAAGFLLKDMPLEMLAEGIRTVATGYTLVDPNLAARVLGRREPSESKDEDLTPREKEILQLVAQGCSNREIGERLYISEGTVKNHLSHVYAKVSARSRTEALRRARERGLLSDHP